MKKLGLATCSLIVAAITINAHQTEFPKLTGPYLGQKPPGRVPELFAPDIFKQRYDRYHSIIVFSPNGKEAYWQASMESKPVQAAIYVSRQISGYWTEPQIAPFSKSKIFDDCPFISPDGKRLYFLSTRPMSEGGELNKGENIWVMDRTEDGWSEPKPLPPAINSLSKHWQISVDRAGDLYFGVWKVDPVSRRTREHDIYCSRYQNGHYGVPEKLGPEINDPDSRQYSPYVAPDGSYLVFTRVEKTEPPVIPVVTLNIGYRDKEGEWTKPVVLNDILQIKEGKWGSQATVSPDGKFMFFLKDNGKEIYWVDASFIDELRPKI
jgi:dipeptidyl aminopeptidase/acylaminoacyl peptidase